MFILEVSFVYWFDKDVSVNVFFSVSFVGEKNFVFVVLSGGFILWFFGICSINIQFSLDCMSVVVGLIKFLVMEELVSSNFNVNRKKCNISKFFQLYYGR